MSNPGPAPAKSLTGRLGTAGPTVDDLRRKAHARVAERVDATRSRFKPISLLRQEARRIVDLFLELEVPGWPKPDRDRLAEEVVGDTLGLGPLEELFRDEATQEFMVLAYNQVITRKGEVWLPTSVHFRDPEHYRRTLARLAEQGEPLSAGPQPVAAIDARLPNGFRVVAVLPPAVLDQPPVAVFARGAALPPAHLPGLKPASGVVGLPPARFGPLESPAPGRLSSPDIAGPSSGRYRPADPAATPPARLRPTPLPTGSSGTVTLSSVPTGVAPSQSSARMTDPLARARQKITERLTLQLASARVYDIGKIPPGELQKVVAACVAEYCAQEKLGYDAAVCDQLTLEILAGMHR